MLTLYAIPISLYCAKLRIVLRHKQLEFEEISPPGGYGSDEYKALVPAGNLPALIHGDLQISDSEAIAEYLNEAFPDPQMLPGTVGERAKLRELSRFHDTRLEPAIRALFPHMSTKQQQQAIAEKWKTLCARLEQLDILLPSEHRPLTLADCGLPVSAVWIELLGDLFGFKNPIDNRFAVYLSNLSHHSAVADELAVYRANLENWRKNL